MKKLLILTLLSLNLTACSLFQIHRMDVDQGNIFTDDQVAKLQKGMTKRQVRVIMGKPVLVTIFTANRSEYIYTLKKGNEETLEKRVVVQFRNGVISSVTSR